MTMCKRLAGAAGVMVLGVSLAGGAHAAGLEANGYDWSLLFDPATYTAQGTVVYVDIHHDHTNPVFAPGAGTVVETKDQIYYNFGIKADLAPNVRCLASAQNPFGSEVERDPGYASSVGAAASENLTSVDVGLTCAYGVPVGPGVISLIGGVSAQTINYEADLLVTDLEIDDWGVGWRAGLAYEIPAYALRVSAIYNAPIEYELEGTAFGLPASSEATTPQSIEITAQTGIAPGWLVLASAKWTAWSVLQTLDVDTALGTISSDLSYRDSWMLTAGVGHQVNEQLSLLASVSWDQGASNPVSDDVFEAGASVDRLGVALGGAYAITEAAQFTGGVALSSLADGSNLQGERWDDSYVLAFSGGFKGSF